jgi:hypothetical protein
MYLNGFIFQAHCVNFEIKKEQIATLLITHFRLFMYLNGVNLQEHCVNFEIKFQIIFVFKSGVCSERVIKSIYFLKRVMIFEGN